MTALPTVSLVIVSRNRPKELRLLLISLRYLTYPSFEVIVVCPDDPRLDFPDIFGIDRIKYVQFDQPNISAARNRGIAVAVAEIVAFCDDDAVPEPTWLNHLAAPFSNSDVGAAGGYVRGRNGITFQWKGRSFDALGSHSDLSLKDTEYDIFQGTAQIGIKTEGTNCAFRRSMLTDLGGFDENFHYFLDETDLNYRLGIAGWKTAIVPLAQVHHGYAASHLRSPNRAPRDLHEIGASSVYFYKKHNSDKDLSDLTRLLVLKHRKRLVNFMISGEIEPRNIKRLLKTLKAGIADGESRVSVDQRIGNIVPDPGFAAFPKSLKTQTSRAYVARPFYWRKMRNKATAAAKDGLIVTAFRFTFTSLFHRVRFLPAGYWLHSGGIYGRAQRNDKTYRLATLQSRAKEELDALSEIRPAAELAVVTRRQIYWANRPPKSQ